MLKIRTPYNIDTALYEKEIGVTGFSVYINEVDYIIKIMKATSEYITSILTLEESVFYGTAGRVRSVFGMPYGIRDPLNAKLDRQGLVEVFLKYYNIKPAMFQIADGSERSACFKFSLDRTKVCKPVLEELEKQSAVLIGYTTGVEIMENYINYTAKKHYYESLTAKYKNGLLQPTELVDNFNRPLRSVRSLYIKQSTGRYYTREDNLQGWNLDAVECFTVPKDYCLVWADFDQIDLRVAINLVLAKGNPELLEYCHRIDDKYKAVAMMIYQSAGKIFDERKFQINRKAYKTSILARLYGAGLHTLMGNGFTDMQEVRALDDYFKNHAYYNKYKASFTNAIKFKEDVIIKDYFGFKRIIPKATNVYAEKSLLEQCLNTPIQSTSNSIVMLWCLEVLKRFRELGFGPDKVRPYLMRHDEGVFMVHKDAIKYSWIFKECSSIFIDNWSELTVNPAFGYFYKKEDEDLTVEYTKSCELNSSKITNVSPDPTASRRYIPCGTTMKCYAFAIMNKANFAISVLGKNRDYEIDCDEIKNNLRKKPQVAEEIAEEVLTEYRATHARQRDNIVFACELYEQYYDKVYFTWKNTSYCKSFKELLEFCKQNSIGYLEVINGVDNSVQRVDDIIIKTVQESYLPNVIQSIERIEKSINDQRCNT